MSSRRQTGYVLLALVLVLFVSGSSFLISAMNSRQTQAVAQQQEVLRQLAIAKENLLAYAAHAPMLYNEQLGPGYLPCPDTDNDGWPQAASGIQNAADTLCPAGVTLGRLPQRIMTQAGEFRFSDFNARIDQQFWYAVAPQHLRTSLNTPAATRTNAALTRLTLDTTGGIAALLFAPGEALGSQDRAADATLYTNYLDGTNGTSATDFISHYAADPEAFNDTVIAISHLELMSAIGPAVAARIKPELDLFHDSNNQYPATLSWDPACVPVAVTNAMSESWMGSEGWNAASNCNVIIFGLNVPFTNHRRHTFTSYVRPNANVATIGFSGCPGLQFTLTHDGTVTQQGTVC